MSRFLFKIWFENGAILFWSHCHRAIIFGFGATATCATFFSLHQWRSCAKSGASAQHCDDIILIGDTCVVSGLWLGSLKRRDWRKCKLWQTSQLQESHIDRVTEVYQTSLLSTVTPGYLNTVFPEICIQYSTVTLNIVKKYCIWVRCRIRTGEQIICTCSLLTIQ